MPTGPDKRAAGQRDPAEVAAQRRRAVRMALWLALVAAAIYIAFILSGVLAS